MDGYHVVVMVVGVVTCVVTLGTVGWRLASTVERVSLLVERLSLDLMAQARRIEILEATRPTDAAVTARLEALQVEIERDSLRRGNEPRQAYEGARVGPLTAGDAERPLRGRR